MSDGRRPSSPPPPGGVAGAGLAREFWVGSSDAGAPAASAGGDFWAEVIDANASRPAMASCAAVVRAAPDAGGTVRVMEESSLLPNRGAGVKDVGGFPRAIAG